MKRMGQFLAAGGFLGVLLLLILYRGSVSQGIYRAISYSLSVLIPSLLPFMFVSGWFSLSPSCRWLCRAFTPLGRLLNLSPAAAPAVLFGLTCGYPVGAKLTAELLERGEISENEAGRLMLFAMSPGIPFCVLFLGSTVLGNPRTGLFLYLALTISCLCAGLILGLLSRKSQPCKKLPAKKASGYNPMVAIKKAADSTIKACLNMCIYIILFWGFMGLLHESGLFGLAVRYLPLPFCGVLTRAGLLSFFFEVTGGITDSVTLGLPPSIFAMGLSFGGICIHLQLFSFFKSPPVKYGRFLFWRVVQAALSYGSFHLFQLFFPDTVTALAPLGNAVLLGTKSGFVGSFGLLILFITYVAISEKETVENSKKT